jgi:hypothetical protein
VNVAVRKAGGDPNRIAGGVGAAGASTQEGAAPRPLLASRENATDGAEKEAALASGSVIKARVVKLNPQRGSRGPKTRGLAAKAVDAHLRYLERDGVTKDREKGRVYSADENEADGRAFVTRGREDRGARGFRRDG